MIARLASIFAAPTFPGDEHRTQRARLFNLSYFFCIGWLAFTMFGNIVGRQIHPVISLLLAVSLLLGLVPYFWVRRGRLEAGAAIWLIYSFFVATLGLAFLGTIRAPALGFYLVLVICAVWSSVAGRWWPWWWCVRSPSLH